MRREASRELLAPRAEVWAFLSEPHNLADWWPRVRGVQPDRRGFAAGARWQVMALERLPLMGWREPKRPVTLAITRIEPFERWAWHLATDTPLDVEVRVATAGEERTLATVAVTGSVLAAPGKLARAAVARLYDLCQTGAVP